MTRNTRKEEKDNVQREQPNDEEHREVQLLRDLRVRDLYLRLPEERLPLPGTQLPVWLRKTRPGTVAAKSALPAVIPWRAMWLAMRLGARSLD